MNWKHHVEEHLTRTQVMMCASVRESLAAPTAAVLHHNTRLPFSCSGINASCWLLFSPTVQDPITLQNNLSLLSTKTDTFTILIRTVCR